jgi:hypothetical protein
MAEQAINLLRISVADLANKIQVGSRLRSKKAHTQSKGARTAAALLCPFPALGPPRYQNGPCFFFTPQGTGTGPYAAREREEPLPPPRWGRTPGCAVIGQYFFLGFEADHSAAWLRPMVLRGDPTRNHRALLVWTRSRRGRSR